jgi:8-oxo-dGTP diphosphatase
VGKAGARGASKAGKTPRPSRAGKKGTIELAFDHRRIVDMAQMCLVERLRDPTRAASFDLVPSHFTMSELQRVYEVVLQRPLDKRNFRAKLVAAHLIESASASRRGPHRPAQLYRWKGAPR